MLFALAGMMLMATATDLLVIFLALEVLSLAVYVLTGIRRDSPIGDRGGVQVLPARRVLERVLPLRHRVHLRPRPAAPGSTAIGSADCRAGDGADADAAAGASACCSSASRSRCRRCRSTCGRPTPTKARRRRSPASCRPASRRRRSRRSCACSCRRSSRCSGALERRSSGSIAAATMIVGTVVGVAQTQRQADAGVFEHRARRLPAGGAGRRRTTSARARSSSTCSTYAVTNLGAFGVIALLDTADRPNDQVRDYAGLWNDAARRWRR